MNYNQKILVAHFTAKMCYSALKEKYTTVKDVT